MATIFEYLDFRQYLSDFYKERKSQNCFFSYQVLAQKAGFNNKGFVYNIIKGTKKLTKTHCFKLSQALGHSKKEADYFENIVAYAQAKNEEERSFFLQKALQITNTANSTMQLLRQDQFEFYATWYHSAVRSFVNLFPVNDNFCEVGKRLSPPITVSQVKKSIQLLERLEMIKKGEDGVYRLTNKSIRTGKDISQTARSNFHLECTELARHAIKNVSPAKRNAVSITMGLSEKTYREVVAETETFVNSLVAIVQRDAAPAERVYQYELLLFPLSRDERKEEKK